MTDALSFLKVPRTSNRLVTPEEAFPKEIRFTTMSGGQEDFRTGSAIPEGTQQHASGKA